MAKSLAHLFDYDNVIINKAETMIDRFLEILEIPEDRQEEVRDKLVNMVSVKMLIEVVKKAPAEKQLEAKEKLQGVDTEYLLQLRKLFKDNELIYLFNDSFKSVMLSKFTLLRPQMTTSQIKDTEALIGMIGKF